jgi:hypothetical protein
MRGIIFHSQCFSTSVGIDEFSNHQTAIIDRISFGDGERIALYGFDGPPNVNNLYSALQ